MSHRTKLILVFLAAMLLLPWLFEFFVVYITWITEVMR
jgi:hypothetical protein